jgi:CRP/FNR family transcriptional regulator, cyclic AMP receptor protein
MTTRAELRATGALASFSDRDLDVFLTAAEPQTFEPGADLCRQGDRGTACFLVLSGEIDVIKRTKTATRALTTLRRGDIAGQLALVDNGPRTAGLRARTRVKTLTLTCDIFDTFLRANSPMALRFQLQIAAATARQIREASRRLTAILEAAPERGPCAQPTNQSRSTSANSVGFLEAAATEMGVSLDDLDDLEVVEQPRQGQPKDPGRW